MKEVNKQLVDYYCDTMIEIILNNLNFIDNRRIKKDDKESFKSSMKYINELVDMIKIAIDGDD